MKVVYRIYNDWTKSQATKLLKYGIVVEEGTDRFDIEDGQLYGQIEQMLRKWDVKKSSSTIYSDEDIRQSSYLVYISLLEDGYPQPEDPLEYVRLTYDTKEYCVRCGIQKKQVSPFRLKKVPVWKKKKMFELKWVQDEIFVEKDFYESFFKPKGVEFKPVLLYKNDNEISNTVQLEIPTMSSSLGLGNQPFDVCEACGEKKYSPQIEGYFPAPKPKLSDSGIFRTKEYFGSGGAAFKRILITSDVYWEMIKLGQKPLIWATR